MLTPVNQWQGLGWGVLAVGLYLTIAVTAASVLAWLLEGVLSVSYDKILSRGVLLFAALGLVPLVRMSALSPREMGLRPVVVRDAVRAFPLGLVALLPLILVFIVTGFRVIDDRVVYIGDVFLGWVAVALIGALLVGWFEETLFRGVLFSVLCERIGVRAAAVSVGLIYAGVHFLQAEPIAHEVQWYSGYSQIGLALQQAFDWSRHWESFLTLFLLGLFFCWIKVRVGLWYAIGLHAGFVFGIRLFKEITVRDVVNPYQMFVGSYDNFVGHLASFWLLFIFVVIALHQRWVTQ